LRTVTETRTVEEDLRRERLEVDRSGSAARGGAGAALAHTIVALGAAFGLRTAAQGWRTRPSGRGYLFARPTPAVTAPPGEAAAAIG
jgi:hypothetical protein